MKHVKLYKFGSKVVGSYQTLDEQKFRKSKILAKSILKVST